jgi:hypothetical protein
MRIHTDTEAAQISNLKREIVKYNKSIEKGHHWSVIGPYLGNNYMYYVGTIQKGRVQRPQDSSHDYWVNPLQSY